MVTVLDKVLKEASGRFPDLSETPKEIENLAASTETPEKAMKWVKREESLKSQRFLRS